MSEGWPPPRWGCYVCHLHARPCSSPATPGLLDFARASGAGSAGIHQQMGGSQRDLCPSLPHPSPRNPRAARSRGDAFTRAHKGAVTKKCRFRRCNDSYVTCPSQPMQRTLCPLQRVYSRASCVVQARAVSGCRAHECCGARAACYGPPAAPCAQNCAGRSAPRVPV